MQNFRKICSKLNFCSHIVKDAPVISKFCSNSVILENGQIEFLVKIKMNMVPLTKMSHSCTILVALVGKNVKTSNKNKIQCIDKNFSGLSTVVLVLKVLKTINFYFLKLIFIIFIDTINFFDLSGQFTAFWMVRTIPVAKDVHINLEILFRFY